jgi:hypothetical protein
MTWRSAQELEDSIAQLPQAESEDLSRAFALSLFVGNALYAPDFEPAGDWVEAIVPSPSGTDLLAELHNTGIQYSDSIEYFTLLRIFYHHEILVDYTKTDEHRILDLLTRVHQSGKGHWPYVFGNYLYHKFNDVYSGNRTASLDPASSNLLLAGTPEGVFQVGTLLVGPLGCVESLERRTVEPTLRLALWHCSDPGCQARHVVCLEQNQSSCTQALNAMGRHLADRLGPASEWRRAILGADRKTKWPSGRPYYDLPAAIGDCILGRERSAACLKALRSSYYQRLWALIERAKGIRGDPDQLVSKLSAEEQHQLLLVLPDKQLIEIVDALVSQKTIKIPPSEHRQPKTYAPGWPSDTRTQLSALGLRSNGHPPIVELAAQIWNAYERLGLTDDLAWRVRNHEGSTLRHSIMNFIRLRGPEAAVDDFVLPSKAVTASICDQMYLKILPEEDHVGVRRRLLWKLGFTLARYEDDYQLLRNRIAEFREVVLHLPQQPNEDERARVRSVGVNLFVSVEQFLESLLCFNVWLLSSDHFTGTRFVFTRQDAVASVSRVLGTQVQSGEQVFTWSNSGANALGVLLVYLGAFREWLRSRRDADTSAIRRDPADYPHYSKDTVYVFPFRHVEFWADIAPEVFTGYASVIDRLCGQIGQAELPSVRNGIDHKREEDSFPETDRMLACSSRLQEVLDIADSRLLVPKLFWAINAERDTYGNTSERLADYRNVTVSLWDPSPVVAKPGVYFGNPYIVAPFDFLNQPNSTLAFLVSPRTEYREYWKNYPRRRVIPSVGSATNAPSTGDPADEISAAGTTSECG